MLREDFRQPSSLPIPSLSLKGLMSIEGLPAFFFLASAFSKSLMIFKTFSLPAFVVTASRGVFPPPGPERLDRPRLPFLHQRGQQGQGLLIPQRPFAGVITAASFP